MTFQELQTAFGELVNNTGVNVVQRDNWLNEGYKKFLSAHNWPWATTLLGIITVAYQNNYALPSDWRKFRWLKLNGEEMSEVQMVDFGTNRDTYAINEDDVSILIYSTPTIDSKSTVTSNAEVAGVNVAVEVTDGSIFTVGDQVYIEGISGGVTVKELAMISAVAVNTVTVPLLKHSYDAAAVIFVIDQGIMGEYWYIPVDLSANADTLILPDRWELSVAKYAAHMYYAMMEEQTLSNFWLQKFNEDIARALKDTQLRSAGANINFITRG